MLCELSSWTPQLSYGAIITIRPTLQTSGGGSEMERCAVRPEKRNSWPQLYPVIHFLSSSPTIVFPFLAHELCLKEHYLKLSFREYYSCHLGLSHHVFTLLCGHKSCEHFASTSPNSLPMSLIIDKNDISIYEVVVFLCVWESAFVPNILLPIQY